MGWRKEEGGPTETKADTATEQAWLKVASDLDMSSIITATESLGRSDEGTFMMLESTSRRSWSNVEFVIGMMKGAKGDSVWPM